ncbi:MAG: hypothetical protein IJ995_06040 [Clostridia bacterium]|nr:hypothetical protein [Clostridia bacterium]
MAICTFFGHRNCPESIKSKLRATLINLIINYDVDTFYVGHQGQFDTIVCDVLKELKIEYPIIRFYITLAYMPKKESSDADFSNSLLPNGIESVHPRYAIVWRNNWMLRQSDYVVTYITHSWGGAAQFAKKAQAQKKTIFKLGSIFVN